MLRVIFAGSPQFADTIFCALVDAAIRPIAVYTQPDKPKGRGRKLSPNPVKLRASELEIPIYQPDSLRDEEAQAELAALLPDVLVVVAYGQILPQSVLDIPKFGCINVHASLLPRWRGAAPIERAVMAGDHETGVAIMQMEAGLDTGPVYRMSRTPIETKPDDTCANLEQNLASLGAEDLIQVLGELESGNLAPPQPQPEAGVTYANKLTPQDRIPNWHSSAELVAKHIWALRDRLPVRAQITGAGVQILSAHPVEQNELDSTTQPGTLVDANKSGITVQCATDLLRITQLRMEKGKGTILSAADAINGHQAAFVPGHVLAPPE
ncbi:MAG: methionyl-tRNA formyltransferase [Pseudomonadota bacterium]